MEKKLKDYLPYYIGCRCLNTWFAIEHELCDSDWILRSYDSAAVRPYMLENKGNVTWTDSIKPILRRLSDMKEEEAIELARLVVHSEEFMNVITLRNSYGDLMVIWGCHSESEETRYNATAEICWSADQFHYLLKQGFDIWNLIDVGLAQDEKELK